MNQGYSGGINLHVLVTLGYNARNIIGPALLDVVQVELVMQDVVHVRTVAVGIGTSEGIFAGTFVKRLTRDRNIVERDILVHVGIVKRNTGAVERGEVSGVAAALNIDSVDVLLLAAVICPLGVPALLQDYALSQIDTTLINQTAACGSVHIAQEGVVTIVVGHHCITSEQELGVFHQCVGGSQRVNRFRQRVGSRGNLTVVHVVGNGDGLDGHRVVNGDRIFIGCAALGGLGAISSVVDCGTFGSARDGHGLDGVVISTLRADDRSLHLMNNLRDGEGLGSRIDGDGVFTSIGQLNGMILVTSSAVNIDIASGFSA